ncbi:ABC-type transport system, substrate-binding protein [Actinokineospora alba]|uniref:ABC-type transport system, substrate-binding protein n=1 Tax=Actinokineospora alba TaxID=504798 RepID=A0A1H0RPQ3_9PSEU|nr:ABC transporter family substrate-binding protein [Actinokineospora alba]TDP66976.1 ABC-type transport system substrate-binding protein [Actinokineospora alba]SDJ32641.1 ABC-type transport system, substrate-binding protein [Actinokineospora alba]SDP31390.1 ABC-type transport system, substrate-binding protein [Actinokineospora alba]
MRKSRWVLAASTAVVCLTSCTNAPPPPLVTTEVAQTAPTRPVNPGEAVVGVDSVAGGLNPHKLSDQSMVTTALAQAMLPSVFRTGPDGTPQLDQTLMLSAQVTNTEPYTVTYRLRPEASWSDAAPIAAEDFVYLWERLRDEPGVIDGMGYRLISNISAREAGRVVEVTFAKPYPGWRSLFSSLLPAHLVKDSPGGWANVLADNYPVTGGPFSLRLLDRVRGEVILERNDRYWDPPAALDRIVLRRGDLNGITGALRTAHNQLALTALGAQGVTQVAGLGASVTHKTVPRPSVATVLLRPVSPAMADVRVRSAIAAIIDRGALVKAGTGGGPQSALTANAQVLAPGAAGYAATGPNTGPDPALAERLLTEAGYLKTAGTWTSTNAVLNLVIAVPADRPAYAAMAAELRKQLTAAGITVKVVSPPGAELFTTLPAAATAKDPVDLLIAPLPVSQDPATALATRFGCASTSDDAPGPIAANPVGFCDPTIQATIDSAVTGEVPLASALAALEPVLWNRALTLPLYQEADDLIVRTDMTGVTAGPPLAGPFAGAATWRRAAK